MAYYSNGEKYSGGDTGSNVGLNGSIIDLDSSQYTKHNYQQNDDDNLLITTKKSSIISDSKIRVGMPIYSLEHLATFTLNREAGILTPADGMKKLLHLEKTTGIWSQKMKLCFDNHWILIMDYETGEIIERFPFTFIHEPTAYISKNPMDMYNNILVFIVAAEVGSNFRSEMHIFQSQNVSAVLLVEDLKKIKDGDIVTRQHDQLYGGDNSRLSKTEVDSGNDSTDEASSMQHKHERDIKLLNHCFDDIERFIIRLQHVAAASRELGDRQRNRKTDKANPGDGILALRTRPPYKRDFNDIFEKFKVALNLLAKLKNHIYDPNATELVHFLFTPLALTVEAATESYAELNLPANCIEPLLTMDTINFLSNCMTAKEIELWRSLGDCWTIAKENWHDSRSDISSELEGNIAQITTTNQINIEDWLKMLESRYAKIVQVIYHRTANNGKELTVFRGEYLEIIDGTRNWWKVRNINNDVGYVPHTIITPYNYSIENQENTTTVAAKKIESAKQNSFCPPPPPPPPERQTSTIVHSNKEKNDTNDNEEQINQGGNSVMHEELKHALSLFREKRKQQQDRFINLDLLKTPDCFIQQKSQPTDIENWLKLKGFSERSQKVLTGLNGEQLFSLNNQNLEELCGKKEGKRLESQILIQKKISGYKTTRSTELFAVLARARQKIEQPSSVDKHEEDKPIDNENV